jgi:hypothetical protein
MMRFSPLLVTVSFGLLAGLACNNSSGNSQTINVNGLDCGLLRADMVGTWTIVFTSGMPTMQNCGGANAGTEEGKSFNVVGATVNYTVSDAAVSQQSVGFSATGTGPNNLSNELIVTIEADSCLATVQAWQINSGGAPGWPVCIGTADRVNRVISTVCDSVQLDTNGDNKDDTHCDLTPSQMAAVSFP